MIASTWSDYTMSISYVTTLSSFTGKRKKENA